MRDYQCNTCDKTIKLKQRNKRLNTKSHKTSSMSIIKRICVKSPNFFEIEDILKKHVDDYNERFGFCNFICEWKLDFDSVLICVRSDNKMNTIDSWDLKR